MSTLNAPYMTKGYGIAVVPSIGVEVGDLLEIGFDGLARPVRSNSRPLQAGNRSFQTVEQEMASVARKLSGVEEPEPTNELTMENLKRAFSEVTQYRDRPDTLIMHPTVYNRLKSLIP